MKHTLTYIILLLYGQLSAQVSVKNMRLTKPDSNVLFMGIGNWIKVSLPNAEKVTMTAGENTSISSFGNNEFNLVPKEQIPNNLKIYVGTRLVAQRKYSVDTVGIFKIQLGNLKTDTASVNEILANKGLRTVNENSLLLSPFRVISFYIIGLNASGDTLVNRMPADGNIISTDQAVSIRKLTKNDKLIFYHPVISGPGMKSRTLDPLILVIK